MRPDSGTSEMLTEVTKRQIAAAIQKGDWIAVQAQVHKLTTSSAPTEADKANQAYAICALGLALLHQNKYIEAARCFLNIEPGMVHSPNEVMSPNDVANYGAICALATMDRSELQRRVLDNSSFRSYLELEPQLRRAVSSFVNSRYSASLTILENYRNDYLLDIHLSRHVHELYATIRSKSIVEYFIPFSCVTLDSLNKAFSRKGQTIDAELIEMISSGQLEARIDTQNKVNTRFYRVHALYTNATRASYCRPKGSSCYSSERNPRNCKQLRA